MIKIVENAGDALAFLNILLFLVENNKMSESLIDVNERWFTCGITRSGKTFFNVSIYEKLDTFCIYINTNAEVAPENASDIIVHSIDELIYVTNNMEKIRAKKICYSPTINRGITEKDIETITHILFVLGGQINKKRKEPIIWCHIFIDEVHEYSSVHRKNKIIDSLWKRGARYGIIAVGISQRPSDVSHTILTQSQNHVIFKVSPYEVPYFEHYHIPIEEFEEHIKKDYHFVVFDGYEVKEAYPIQP